MARLVVPTLKHLVLSGWALSSLACTAEQPAPGTQERSFALEADAGNAETGGEATDAAPPIAADGVYLVGKYVETAETQNTFFATVSAATAAELSGFDAEVSGQSLGSSNLVVSHGNAVFVPAALAPELTRFELTESGELVQGATLSFASTGLVSLTGWQLAFVSDSKAYLVDSDSSRVLIWNPTTMELSDTVIDISGAQREGLTVGMGAREARLVGERLFVPTYWYTDELDVKASAVLVLDTATDQMTRVASDDRCPGYMLVALPSGDLHMFPDGYFSQAFYLNQEAPRTPLCSLRIRAGEETFDPEYAQDLGALVGGDELSGGGVQGGISDGQGGIYLSVADEALFAAGETNVYRTWHWDPATGAARELPDVPLWSDLMLSYEQGGQRFGLAQSLEQTTVIDLSAEPFNTFTLPGWVDPFVRVR